MENILNALKILLDPFVKTVKAPSAEEMGPPSGYSNINGQIIPNYEHPFQTNTPTSTPVSTPTPQPTSSDILAALVKPSGGVTYENALPVVNKIITNYQPKTSDVPPGWITPLKNHINLLAQVSAQYGLDPRLLPLLAIAETQNLRPLASGTSKNNPFNTMGPGTQNLFPYPNIETAIKQYASGVGQPRYSSFKQKLKPESTFRDFINIQNPSDNPEQEQRVFSDVANQLGI